MLVFKLTKLDIRILFMIVVTNYLQVIIYKSIFLIAFVYWRSDFLKERAMAFNYYHKSFIITPDMTYKPVLYYIYKYAKCKRYCCYKNHHISLRWHYYYTLNGVFLELTLTYDN